MLLFRFWKVLASQLLEELIFTPAHSSTNFDHSLKSFCRHPLCAANKSICLVSGGGYGDGRINLRGFNSENVAVLINGIPVNDMENGRVYWSNWAGLGDVTSSMQVQRGLGASNHCFTHFHHYRPYICKI